MDLVWRHQAKRDECWPEMERFFEAIPPHLSAKAACFRLHLSIHCMPSGQLRHFLLSDQHFPVVDMPLWLLDDIGLPAGDYSGQEYGAIVYGRGPLFIVALAETMGQKTFDEFYRDYYQLYKWGIAGGHEFKEMAERHCRCDLTPLFEEWVYEK